MTDRLTHDGDYKQHLAWSPDGKKFLFTRVHRGKMGLWTMNADGTELKRLLNLDTPHFDGHWSGALCRRYRQERRRPEKAWMAGWRRQRRHSGIPRRRH